MYIYPKCECGGELYGWVEVLTMIEYAITKSGKITKRPKNHIYEEQWLVEEQRKLYCKECSLEYLFELDDKERVILIRKY